LLPTELNRAVGVVGFPRGGGIAGGLNNLGIGITIKEGSPTGSFHLGGDIALGIHRREISLGDIVNLLSARGAKVDAVEGTGVTANDGGNDLKELVDGQITGNGLNAGKGLCDAELVVVRSIGETNSFPGSGVNLFNKGGKGTGLGGAEHRLEVRSAATGDIGDNKFEGIVGARATRAETLQPGIDGGNDGTVGSLQENLEKTVRIETLGPRVSSNGNDGAFALGGNVAKLSECAANSRGNKERTGEEHD